MKMKKSLKMVGLVAAAAVATPAFAGAGGTEFDTVYNTIKDWVEGTLGRILAVAMVIVGITMGIARQSLMSFAVGIAAGLGLYTAPGIINTVMTATL